MAKLEKTITGNFNEILHRIEDGIINGSVSASLEESSDFSIGDTRCDTLPDLMDRKKYDIMEWTYKTIPKSRRKYHVN